MLGLRLETLPDSDIAVGANGPGHQDSGLRMPAINVCCRLNLMTGEKIIFQSPISPPWSGDHGLVLAR